MLQTRLPAWPRAAQPWRGMHVVHLALLQQGLVDHKVLAHAPSFQQQQLLLRKRLSSLWQRADVRVG